MSAISRAAWFEDWVPMLLSADFSREVGVLGITTFYYSFVAIHKRCPQLKNVPPVLSSTASMWLGLTIIDYYSKPIYPDEADAGMISQKVYY